MGVNNSLLFLISFFLILSPSLNFVLVSSGQCLKDQRSLLIELNGSLKFDEEVSTKLVKWNLDEDCCTWNGVGCDTSGHVTSLELDNESISSGIENATSLFKLHYLQKLNFAYNIFSSMQIPSGISNLKNLVHLNLSEAGFVGQIPIELSYLRKLVTLDLSTQYLGDEPLKLENPNLKTLVHNLQNLEELYLDGVEISAQRSKWSQALASSLPRLRILSLRYCQIEGPIDASLSKLGSLSVIQLDRNNLSTTVPDFFANFSNLTTLSLTRCNLMGKFPGTIFQVPTLQNLYISGNYLLHGSLEQFPLNDSLRALGFRNLSRIELSSCNFSGTISPAMVNLSKLVYLDFSFNSFSGSIPLFHNSKNLSYINLSENELTESLSPSHFRGLSKLEYLHLESNSLSGSIPSSIFSLPSLKELHLFNNKLSGKIDEIPNAASSLLETLFLDHNCLNGSIPDSIFKLRKLSTLYLSYNSFTGTIKLESIINLVNLTRFSLSHNKISVDPFISNPSMLPQLEVLGLASSKLKIFPNLANQSQLVDLDLSDNQIKGEIPTWIWNVADGYGGYFRFVNLSLNLLVGMQKPYTISNLGVLDLHSNHLHGEIPIPPASAFYVDYSSNNFIGSIPTDIGNNLSRGFFSLAHNSLTGSIPWSLCNVSLQVIDFSDNSLTGKIPSCILENNDTLSVLNLARNNLIGYIPDNFPDNSVLQTLDLSSNALEGKIPRSLINCAILEVLNIGNNKLEDAFPCNLKYSSSLRVLILRSNKLYGDVICTRYNNIWPELQIIDIASNNFGGNLSSGYFSGWRRLILDDNADAQQFQGKYLRLSVATIRGLYYPYKVVVTIKGIEIELVKILMIFTSIDFSNNKFSGKIPDTIGDLRSLYLLNLSHNAFTGKIPSSIGKLKSLGSLDMSVNKLNGEIPATLSSLTFLAFFNVSFNKLIGKIPTGPQLQTFTSASYEGNIGLCAFPLSKTCTRDQGPSPSFKNMESNSKTEIKWEYVLAPLGFTMGLASFIAVLLLCKAWREKYFYYVDKFLLKIVKQKGAPSISEQRFRDQPTRRH